VAEIEVLRLLGNVYQEKDQLQKAHSYRVTAAKLAEDPRSHCPPEEQMRVEGDLGRSYIAVHDWPKAEAHTQRALEIAESLPDERNRCIYKMNLGLVYVNTDREQEAFRLGGEVLRVAKRLPDHYILGLQHLNLASFLIQKVRLNDSQRHARQALAHADLSGDARLRMSAQRVLGESFRLARLLTGRREYSADAEHHLQQTVELARTLDNPSLEADAEIEFAELCEDRRQPTEAANHYRRGLELLEKVRSGLGYEEFQLTYFRSFEPIYNRVTEFLLRQGQSDHAFLTTERLRSRLLLARLGQRRSNVRTWSNAQKNELTEILNLYGRAVMDNKTTPDSPAICEARQKFLNLYQSQRLYRANWQLQQSTPAVSFEEAQRFLSRDDALLAYLVTDRSIVIFVATDQVRHFQHLNYSRDKIKNDMDELYEALEAVRKQVRVFRAKEWFARGPGNQWPATIKETMARLHRILEKLYAVLVAPVLAVIDQKPHWVIVPHGPLHRLPWAALRNAGRYLVEQHSISLLPSSSVGAVLAVRKPSVAGEVVCFTDPGPELPGAQLEVQAVNKALQMEMPPFTTKSEFIASAPNARLLHLACHHYFDANAPLLSFLKLAGDEGSDYLYAFEVAELCLSAHLVSLSTCESGRSHVATGDEQVGMVPEFLTAGAYSVVSTLWLVDDESSAAFFAEFYKHACKNALGQALSITQRRLLENPRYELPYFWAPYVISGQWTKPLMFSLKSRE
jgi:tetratricopeptide (TPR) repeat protein